MYPEASQVRALQRSGKIFYKHTSMRFIHGLGVPLFISTHSRWDMEAGRIIIKQNCKESFCHESEQENFWHTEWVVLSSVCLSFLQLLSLWQHQTTWTYQVRVCPSPGIGLFYCIETSRKTSHSALLHVVTNQHERKRDRETEKGRDKDTEKAREQNERLQQGR